MNPSMRLVLVATFVVSACEPGPTSQPAGEPSSAVLASKGGNKCAVVTVYPTADTIPIGGTVALVDTVANKKGFVLANEPVQWASQNNAVAAVNSSGLVTGVSVGIATIAVTCDTGLTATSIITVVP